MPIRPSRLFLIAAGLVLCLPLALGLLQPNGSSRSHEEDRGLAPWPSRPLTVDDWRALPKALDAFLADHFGLRAAMIRLQSAIAYRWLGEANPDVLIGHGGRLFYYGDEAIAQSAGVTFRPEMIDHTVDVLTEMREVLAARGVRLVVGAPPNAASVYDDDLPAWARSAGRDVEPVRILDMLKARGFAVADLRETLRAARNRGNLFRRTDTHWTLLGALLAYDAVAVAAGHGDWVIEPGKVLGNPVRFDTGDLARMLGAGADLSEMTPDWTLPSVDVQVLGPPEADLQLSTGVPGGPAVFILGDSFTEGTFATLAAGHAGRIGWLHANNCGFDWSWLDSFKPDEVWWLPTERLMLCNLDTWPKGMPHGPDAGDHAVAPAGVPETHG